jgi:DNA-binding MarR family transcriptional regulator
MERAPDQVGVQVLRDIRRILRHVSRYSRRIARDAGLSVPQVLCLRTLADADGEVTVGAIADAVQLSRSTATGLVDGLVKKGLITRVRSAADRRRVVLGLTPAGRDRLVDLPAPLEDGFLRRLADLPDEEQRQLLDALGRVVDLMGAEQLDASPLLVPGDDLRR